MTFTHRLIKHLAVAAMVAACGVATASVDLDAAQTAITQKLEKVNPEIKVKGVFPTPVENILEVQLERGMIVYSTPDASYMLNGDLFQLTDKGMVNLKEEQQKVLRVEVLKRLDVEEMIRYPAKETKGVITVFTDVDCPYCQKLHEDVPDLNARGIEVRYLAYPRLGLKSDTYERMVSVWCAPDRAKALDQIKRREPIEHIKCDSPVAKHFEIGQQLGVNGTPSILLEDGSMVPGYQAPAELSKMAIAAHK